MLQAELRKSKFLSVSSAFKVVFFNLLAEFFNGLKQASVTINEIKKNFFFFFLLSVFKLDDLYFTLFMSFSFHW